MKAHRTLATVTAALLVGPMLMAVAAQAAPAGEEKAWSPALLSTEPLYSGSAVRLRYTEGITVVASAGAKVIFTGSMSPTTTQDGRRVYDREVQIVDPQGVGQSSAEAAAYSAAGRSVYADALAAGFSPAEARQEAQPQGVALLDEPPIAASGCVYSETNTPDPEFEWSGCYKLYNVDDADASAWYGAGSGTAHGWGTGVLGGGKELSKGFTEITWSGSGAEIIEASPSANQNGINCGQFTVGLSQVVELSYQVPLCNDGWNVTWNQTVHKVEWHGGSAGGSNDSRSASGASTVRLPWSTPTVYMNYRIGWQYACFC
ncbi:hypothetical protein DDE19_05370 [Micromonospora ureilytica]|uniref:Peptidase n=1 Tax=Micromonospora ureilytica TaxID=709868 RepID=A0A3N9YHL8_9ACTN|nr:hypothetical protein [Micromonospora ureilytica]RQX19117.1 hypothetical protein DDE19_05370 [Micromonospora ureilytica]